MSGIVQVFAHHRTFIRTPGAAAVTGVITGDGQATVSFAAPLDTGGMPITSYSVTSTPGNITATGTSSPITITGLTNGTTYTFIVRAINSSGGVGDASSTSSSVSPLSNGWVSAGAPSTQLKSLPFGMVLDSVNNVYLANPGLVGAYGPDANRVKYTSSGTTVTPYFDTITLSGSTYSALNYDVTTDSSNNTYFVGMGPAFGSAKNALIYKCSSSGTIQWARSYGTTTDSTARATGNNTAYATCVDSSDNVYMVGACTERWSNSSPYSGQWPFIVKYDTNGNLLWQRLLVTAADGAILICEGAQTDSSGNLYISTYANYLRILTKISPSGSLIWVRVIAADNSYNGSRTVLAIDSSNNIYLTSANIIYKFNSSGTNLWQRSYTTQWKNYCIAVDGDGNVYSGGDDQLVKIDTNGNTVWQRSIQLSIRSITIKGSDMYIAGFRLLNSNNTMVCAKLPTSGADTGTLSTGYASTSITYSSATYPTATPTATVGDATSNYTLLSSSYPSNSVTVSATTPSALFYSSAITHPTAPMNPTIDGVVVGDGRAFIAFTAPSNNGGSVITGYTVTSTPGNIIATGTSSPITITGLTNGTAYNFTISATNAIGSGLASTTTTSVTPSTNY